MAQMTILLFSVLLLSVARCDTNSTPQQIHVVFGGAETEYVISWVTFGYRPPAPHSQVRYGPSRGAMDLLAVAKPQRFIEDRCLTSRIMHNVVLKNLAPGARVFYRVTADGKIWSDVFAFTVFPRSDAHRPMRISVAGDLAIPPVSNSSSMDYWANETAQGAHDFVIHLGDIAYDVDTQCGEYGDEYMRKAQGVGAYIPYFYGIGNHETDLDYTYRSYLARYAGLMPLANASGSDTIRWFSFDAQLVHFVYIDTDAWVYPEVYGLARPQLRWLVADLDAVDRAKTPWIIMMAHRAMYCVKNADAECNGQAEAIRVGYADPNNDTVPGIENLLLKYGVDIFMAGHTHHYQRTWPVINKECAQKDYYNPRGPIHIQSGIGGVDSVDPFELPPKDYDAWRDETYRLGFTRIVIHNSTHVSFSQRTAASGEIFDNFTVVQHRHGPFAYSAAKAVLQMDSPN